MKKTILLMIVLMVAMVGSALGAYKCEDKDGDTYFKLTGGGGTPPPCSDNDCDDNNAKIYQSVTLLSTDADHDRYIFGSAAGTTQCVGGTAIFNTKTYYNDSTGAYTRIKNADKLGTNDCNDASATVYQNLNGYVDGDADTYTVGSQVLVCSGASLPSGYAVTSAGTDCDDSVAICNTNCVSLKYQDADIDNFGNAVVSKRACDAPAGYVSDNTDCDDSNSAIKPGASEVCNGVDDNCNAQTDEGVKNTYFQDSDSDTYGNSDVSQQACTAPSGYVSNSNDCNDASADVNPGVSDSNCNGVDDNCNGQNDENYVALGTDCSVGTCPSFGLLVCNNGVQSDTCQVPIDPVCTGAGVPEYNLTSLGLAVLIGTVGFVLIRRK